VSRWQAYQRSKSKSKSLSRSLPLHLPISNTISFDHQLIEREKRFLHTTDSLVSNTILSPFLLFLFLPPFYGTSSFLSSIVYLSIASLSHCLFSWRIHLLLHFITELLVSPVFDFWAWKFFLFPTLPKLNRLVLFIKAQIEQRIVLSQFLKWNEALFIPAFQTQSFSV